MGSQERLGVFKSEFARTAPPRRTVLYDAVGETAHHQVPRRLAGTRRIAWGVIISNLNCTER